ncbi:MAG: M48 family metalloprotease, partial [Candidatus Sumerlaeota bacterium]
LKASDPDPQDLYHQRFRNTVEEMAVASGRGGRVRAVVTPALAFSAFAAEDRRQGAVIGITEGLLSRLTRDQMQAVVAHEMAHIREGDARLSSLLCAMLAPFAQLAETLKSAATVLSDENNDEHPISLIFLVLNPIAGGAIFLLGLVVAILTLSMFLISTVFSRERELLADAGAAEFTRNPLALAQALYTIDSGRHFMGESTGAFSPIFIVNPLSSALDDRRDLIGNLFSSHPPTDLRIDAMLKMAGASPENLHVRPVLEGSLQGVPADKDEGLWSLRSKGGWTPPMILTALLAHPEFSPSAFITRQGLFAPIRASAEPRVAGLLAARTSLDGAQSETPERGKCPVCRTPMREKAYEGTQLDICPACHGILVPEHKVKRILSRRERCFSREFIEKSLQWLEENQVIREETLGVDAPARACPQCERLMVERFFSYRYPVRVERCLECNLVFFDGGELERIQALVENYGDGMQ